MLEQNWNVAGCSAICG